LLELRDITDDAELHARIDDRCVKACCWTLDACQFDDGSHGMFGRDDKWVGQTAASILLYAKLKSRGLVPAEVDRGYRPKIERSWAWLLSHTSPDTFPQDGYVRVTGSTTTKPTENLMWMMAWTVEALLDGGPVFNMAD
jgi:hypothetical protein